MTTLKDIQTRLSGMGYKPGVADGIFGRETGAAMMAALADLAKHTGYVDPVSTAKFVKYLPDEWLPDAHMDGIIFHWTGGGYTATNLDRAHYHVLLEGDLDVVRGVPSIADNVPPLNKEKYAAHTLNCNSRKIGVSFCSMLDAVEKPFDAGKYPLLEAQWKKMAHIVAQLCLRYGIAVTDKTVLSHAEVQPNLLIPQRGKWDVARLPFDPTLVGARACGDAFRLMVKALL